MFSTFKIILMRINLTIVFLCSCLTNYSHAFDALKNTELSPRATTGLSAINDRSSETPLSAGNYINGQPTKEEGANRLILDGGNSYMFQGDSTRLSPDEKSALQDQIKSMPEGLDKQKMIAALESTEPVRIKVIFSNEGDPTFTANESSSYQSDHEFAGNALAGKQGYLSEKSQDHAKRIESSAADKKNQATAALSGPKGYESRLSNAVTKLANTQSKLETVKAALSDPSKLSRTDFLKLRAESRALTRQVAYLTWHVQEAKNGVAAYKEQEQTQAASLAKIQNIKNLPDAPIPPGIINVVKQIIATSGPDKRSPEDTRFMSNSRDLINSGVNLVKLDAVLSANPEKFRSIISDKNFDVGSFKSFVNNSNTSKVNDVVKNTDPGKLNVFLAIADNAKTTTLINYVQNPRQLASLINGAIDTSSPTKSVAQAAPLALLVNRINDPTSFASTINLTSSVKPLVAALNGAKNSAGLNSIAQVFNSQSPQQVAKTFNSNINANSDDIIKRLVRI